MNTFTYVTAEQFNPTPFTKMDTSTRTKLSTLAEDFISLDTETSHNHDTENPVGWIYQWAFKYGDFIVYGRKPTDLLLALEKVVTINQLGEDDNMVCYIHNASYDYAYIIGWLKSHAQVTDLLAISSHKIIAFKWNGIIFRCSYRLSLKSLDKWSKEVGTKHRKLVGAVDYDVIRYQDTPLYRNDWRYMFDDVIVLDECIRKTLEQNNDNLKSIPLTSTGYVRRDCREEFRKDDSNGRIFKATQLNTDTYLACRSAFSGGLTHGNRKVRGKTVKAKIRHRDFASHYPSQQICSYAPIGKFKKYFSLDENENERFTMEEFKDLVDRECCLVKISITNLTLKTPEITLPYAQVCKFIDGKLDGFKIEIEDNGRIIKAKGTSVVWYTELDMKWLLKQYDFDYEFIEVYSCKKGKFPKYLRDTVFNYYINKTKYKMLEKDLLKSGKNENSPEYIDIHRLLMISKGRLNGIYGMSATDPIRMSYIDEGEEWLKGLVIDGKWKKGTLTTSMLKSDDEFVCQDDVQTLLIQYYNNYNSFMSYQYGVWTTAQARNELLEFVELIGYDKFLYADTDSIFYISDEETERRLEEKNKEFRDINDEKGYYIDYEGKRVYFNQFELEDEDICSFRFLHAKCYAYETIEDDKVELHATIAGVSAQGRNGNNRLKELGDIDNLEEGFVFEDCGGTTTKYGWTEPHKEYIDGHLTEVSGFAIIVPTTKELHEIDEYIIGGFNWDAN